LNVEELFFSFIDQVFHLADRLRDADNNRSSDNTMANIELDDLGDLSDR
jgi:hypothetical protein